MLVVAIGSINCSKAVVGKWLSESVTTCYQLPYSPVCFTVSPIPELQLTFGVYTPDFRICNGSSDQWWLAHRQWCTDLIEWFHRIGNEIIIMPSMILPDANHAQYRLMLGISCLFVSSVEFAPDSLIFILSWLHYDLAIYLRHWLQ